MRLISMRTIRASDNPGIRLASLFFDHLRIRINTVFKYSYVRLFVQHF